MRRIERAFPRGLLLLAALYALASLAHFSHNAEYIAFYPGMPSWLTREKVYLFWLAVTAPGVLALCFAGWALPIPALLFMGAYGAAGLDGLAHYTIGLCSEHTWVANLTIASEASAGLAVLLASAVLLYRRVRGHRTLATSRTCRP